ncbi:unnamed protein product, partial [Diabrotica balteata]
MASSAKQLQLLLNKINSFCEKCGLKMNIKKNKYMIITKKTNIPTNIHLGNIPIERVDKYKYLGTWISDNNDQTTELRARIEIARNAFVKMKTIGSIAINGQRIRNNKHNKNKKVIISGTRNEGTA